MVCEKEHHVPDYPSKKVEWNIQNVATSNMLYGRSIPSTDGTNR